jgi:hypothetical protein
MTEQKPTPPEGYRLLRPEEYPTTGGGDIVFHPKPWTENLIASHYCQGDLSATYARRIEPKPEPVPTDLAATAEKFAREIAFLAYEDNVWARRSALERKTKSIILSHFASFEERYVTGDGRPLLQSYMDLMQRAEKAEASLQMCVGAVGCGDADELCGAIDSLTSDLAATKAALARAVQAIRASRIIVEVAQDAPSDEESCKAAMKLMDAILSNPKGETK